MNWAVVNQSESDSRSLSREPVIHAKVAETSREFNVLESSPRGSVRITMRFAPIRFSIAEPDYSNRNLDVVTSITPDESFSPQEIKERIIRALKSVSTASANVNVGREKPTYISADFLKFLDESKLNEDFSDTDVIENVKRVLGEIHECVGIEVLPDPQAMQGNHGSLEISWELGEHQFDIEVHPSGFIDWFWRNSRTKNYEGQDNEKLVPLPLRLQELLREAFQGAV